MGTPLLRKVESIIDSFCYTLILEAASLNYIDIYKIQISFKCIFSVFGTFYSMKKINANFRVQCISVNGV